MRDTTDETPAVAPTEAPRGRAALGLSPKGMFYDFVVMPMLGRRWTLLVRIVEVGLVLFSSTVLVIAVYALTR